MRIVRIVFDKLQQWQTVAAVSQVTQQIMHLVMQQVGHGIVHRHMQLVMISLAAIMIAIRKGPNSKLSCSRNTQLDVHRSSEIVGSSKGALVLQVHLEKHPESTTQCHNEIMPRHLYSKSNSLAMLIIMTASTTHAQRSQQAREHM